MNANNDTSKFSATSSSRITLELGPETLATLARIVGSHHGPTGFRGMLKEFGRMVVRAVAPHLTPYIMSIFMGFGAMVTLGWKAVMRGWFGL